MVTNASINADDVFRGAMIPRRITSYTELHSRIAVAAGWPDDLFLRNDDTILISIGGNVEKLFSCDIELNFDRTPIAFDSS